MNKKSLIYSVIFCLLTMVLFSCKKKDATINKEEPEKLIQAYEELGRRHNTFLAKAFPEVKRRLTEAQSKLKIMNAVSPELAYDVMMDVSSEYLVPVTDYQSTQEEILTYLKQYMPQDVVFTEISSTAVYLQTHSPDAVITPGFAQALQELDQLLEQCTDYSITSTLTQSFDALRSKYIPLLTIPAEREAFIAGTSVGKYSLTYWSEHEQEVLALFEENSTLKTTGLIGKQNPVKADVCGILAGAWKGALGGFSFGGLWGSIAFGLLGGAYSGCVASLSAGLVNGLFSR
jgi:hypothetical protein